MVKEGVKIKISFFIWPCIRA